MNFRSQPSYNFREIRLEGIGEWAEKKREEPSSEPTSVGQKFIPGWKKEKEVAVEGEEVAVKREESLESLKKSVPEGEREIFDQASEEVENIFKENLPERERNRRILAVVTKVKDKVSPETYRAFVKLMEKRFHISISAIARSQQEKSETPVAPTMTTPPTRVSVKSPLRPQGQKDTGKGTRPDGEMAGAKGKRKGGVGEKTKHKDEDNKEFNDKVSGIVREKKKIANREKE